MSTLMLLRLKPLSPEELSLLPEGCVPVPESSSVLVRADVDLPLRDLFQLAVKMARAVPDAEFVFHESTAPGARKARAAHLGLEHTSLPTNEHPLERETWDAEILEEEKPLPPETWWSHVEEGSYERALEMLGSCQLGMEDRSKLRGYFRSEDPGEVAFVCRAACILSMKAYVMSIRNFFQHSSPQVRYEAVVAVGKLAGPSLSPSVHLLTSDPDPKVRQAAQKAYKKLLG
jgi:hypothetical protein